LASVRGAAKALGLLLKRKPSVLHFGKNDYWMDFQSENWLILGLGVSHKKENLSVFLRHLKTAPTKSLEPFKGFVALEGVSEAAIDSALRGGVV